jgi:hypothetical protein
MLRSLVPGRGRTSATAEARFRTSMAASVSVPAHTRPHREQSASLFVRAAAFVGDCGSLRATRRCTRGSSRAGVSGTRAETLARRGELQPWSGNIDDRERLPPSRDRDRHADGWDSSSRHHHEEAHQFKPIRRTSGAARSVLAAGSAAQLGIRCGPTAGGEILRACLGSTCWPTNPRSWSACGCSRACGSPPGGSSSRSSAADQTDVPWTSAAEPWAGFGSSASGAAPPARS